MGLSVGLSFEDEIQTYLCGSEGDKINAGSYIPYLSAECQDICLTVQVITLTTKIFHHFFVCFNACTVSVLSIMLDIVPD